MKNTLFTLILFVLSTSVIADPVRFAERLENYRQLTELFKQICMSQPPVDSKTGIGHFAENAVFSNINFSPDDGTVDCNENLKALLRLQKDLESEAKLMETSGEIADCDVPEVLASQAQDDAESSTVAANEVEMQTSCEAEPTAENLCLDRFACSLQNKLQSFLPITPTNARGGSCQGVESLVMSCGVTTIRAAIFDAPTNFFNRVGEALNWSADKVSRASAKSAKAVGDMVFGDEATIDQVDMLSESDNSMVEAFMKFKNASLEEKAQMLRNLSVNMWNGINTAIKKSYGCVKWAGEPYASECVQPMDNFCNAPCEQKVDAVCGVLSYITADAVVSSFTSGATLKIGSMAKNITTRVGSSALGKLSHLTMEIPGMPSLARRMNKIRQYSRINLKIARRFAVIQARQILQHPLSKSIRAGGEAFVKKKGPGVDRATKVFVTSAQFVGKPARWVATTLYSPIKAYMLLSKSAYELGIKSVGTGSKMVSEAVTGAKTLITANLLEARPIDLPPGFVRTQVHYTDYGRYGDPIPRNRWVVTDTNSTTLKSSDLFDLPTAAPAVARAPAKVEGSIVVGPSHIEKRLKSHDEELNGALQVISQDTHQLRRDLDELGAIKFLSKHGQHLSEADYEKIRLLHSRVVNDRYSLSVEGRHPKPEPAPGSDYPTSENFLKAYEKRVNTIPEQNLAFIGHASRATPPGGFFVDSQNRMLKWLNDNLKTKGMVDALSNRHTEMVFEAVEKLKARFPTLNVSPYADYKGIRMFARGPPGKEETLMAEFVKILDEVDEKFKDDLIRSNYVAKEAATDRWFGSGIARTADEANVQARFPRNMTMAQIENEAEKLENMRGQLQSRFKFSGLMVQPVGTRKYILQAEVIEVIRKNKNDSSVIEILNRRYGTKIDNHDVIEMRSYMETADNFSPGLLIESRVVHGLENATEGGITVDFTKFGAYNMEATMAGMAKGHNFKASLANVRQAEGALTQTMAKLKETTETTMKSVLDRHGIKYSITTSGDDMVVVPSKTLSEEVRREIVLEQAKANVPSSMRISFFQEGIADHGHRGLIAAQGESIEKVLRAKLDNVLTQAELKQLTFATDMNGQLPGTGSVGLFTNSSLSAEKMNLVQREFKASVEYMNKEHKTSFIPTP